MTVSIALTKPLQVADESLHVIDLREPTVDDIVKIGYPFLVVDGGIAIQPAIALQYIAKLSGNPPSAIKSLSIADFSRLQTAVMGFFGEGAEASPN